MKLRLPPVTPRNLLNFVSLILVVALVAAFVSPPVEKTGKAKVTRLLNKAQKADRDGSKARSGDSPTAGPRPKRKKDDSIFVTPRRGRRATIGRLEIPSIGLRRRFYEGVNDAVVRLGPGHWPGTPFPGDAGNAVFAGHRTTFTKPFADLDLLQPGDAIKTSIGNSGRVTYRVSKVFVVPEASYVRAVLRQPKSKRARQITLFACTPKGFRTHRIVVRAVADRLPRKDHGTLGGKEATR